MSEVTRAEAVDAITAVNKIGLSTIDALTPDTETVTAKVNAAAAKTALEQYARAAWILASERLRQQDLAARHADRVAVDSALKKAPNK